MKLPTPHEYTAVIKEKEQYSAKVFLFTLELKHNKTLVFAPGQFINIDVGKGVHRQYSIASSPHHSRTIDLLVDVAPGGPGSKYFTKIGAGAHVKFHGPMGKFLLATDTGNITFLSASTGVAPFKSMLDFLFEEQARRKDYNNRHIYLYQTFRHETDVFWDEHFEQEEIEHPNFHYLLTLTRPKPTWTGCMGYVQACMDRQLLRSPNSQFYICGGAKMVEGVLEYLRKNNVPEDRIHFEPF